MSSNRASNVIGTSTTSCATEKPGVIGCQEPDGMYCCVTTKFRCDKCGIWYKCDDFRDMLMDLDNKNFMYQQVRNAMLTTLANIPYQAPFDEDKRFPKRIVFYKVESDWTAFLTQMKTALNVRDRVNELLEKNPAFKIPDQMLLDNERRLNDAHYSFKQAISSLLKESSKCEGGYDREKFEKFYGVIWNYGSLDCTISGRDISHLQAVTCCTFGDFRMFLGLPDREAIFVNARDPYSYSTSVNLSRFTNTININTNQLLPTSPFYIYNQRNSRVHRIEYDENCLFRSTEVTPFTHRVNFVGEVIQSQIIEVEDLVDQD